MQDWKKIKKTDPKLLQKLGAIGIELRKARKGLEQQAGVLKAEQDALEEFLREQFTKSDLRQVKTRAGTISLSEKDVPRAQDWDKIHEHILKTKEFDLLQKRLGEKACQLRWDDGKEIPGVEKYHDARIKFGED